MADHTANTPPSPKTTPSTANLSTSTPSAAAASTPSAANAASNAPNAATNSTSVAKRLFQGWLGLAVVCYIALDFLGKQTYHKHWHKIQQHAFLVVLFGAAAYRACKAYKRWSLELRYVIPFLGSAMFMTFAFLVEMIAVRFVTAALGSDWHEASSPMPDVGQWIMMSFHEKLPPKVATILRASIFTLHHSVFLFIVLAVSVLFNCIKASGLNISARYMFVMGVGHLLRAVSFILTIVPSPHLGCVSSRFHDLPSHPHPWFQKYLYPNATNYSSVQEYKPDWGFMTFLGHLLRPTPESGRSWRALLKGVGGGCNDLMYSGHVFVAALTAMAWTDTYGGFTSGVIWLLVMHSVLREIHGHQNYSVDCVVAIYMAIFLWRIMARFWPINSGDEPEDEVRRDSLEQICVDPPPTTTSEENQPQQGSPSDIVDAVGNVIAQKAESTEVSTPRQSILLKLRNAVIFLFAIIFAGVCFELTNDA